MNRMKKRVLKNTIGKIVIMGTMIAVSYGAGIHHSNVLENKEDDSRIIEAIPNGYINAESKEFQKYYVDMREVIDFMASDDGLQLYYEDGSGYWWER